MGNIGDFDPATDAVPYRDLPAFDRYVLRRTAAMVKDMEAGLQASPGPGLCLSRQPQHPLRGLRDHRAVLAASASTPASYARMNRFQTNPVTW